MIRVIRCNIWETNSSTSHSLVLLTSDDYDKWEGSDKLYAVYRVWEFHWQNAKEKPDKCKLYTAEEAMDLIKQADYYEFFPDDYGDEESEVSALDRYLYDYGFISYNYWDNIELEEDETRFTTPSGDEMVAVCQYGNDY